MSELDGAAGPVTPQSGGVGFGRGQNDRAISKHNGATGQKDGTQLGHLLRKQLLGGKTCNTTLGSSWRISLDFGVVPDLCHVSRLPVAFTLPSPPRAAHC